MKTLRIISVVMMVALLHGCLLCSYPYSFSYSERLYVCTMRNNGVFLRDFYAKLKPVRQDKPAYVAKFSVVLNKGTHYRFGLCDDGDDEGKTAFELYSRDRLLGTSYDKGIDIYGFDFKCQKTAIYYVFIHSKEEWKHERNRAIVVLSFVGKE